MRAILIDPKAHTVTEVEYSGDYRDICKHIDAPLFDIVRMGDKDRHVIYVDDEGLIRPDARSRGMFRVNGDNPAYLAGRGLLVAASEDGEDRGATMGVEQVRALVAFGEPMRIGLGMYFAEHPTEVMPDSQERIWRVDN